MKASIEEVNTVQRRVTVEVPVDKVDAAFTHLFQDIRRKAHLKGFRPGKAPLPMIKRFYGDSVVGDVFEKLVKDTLFNAIQENELRPVASPVIETSEMPKEGEAYAFTALVDVMPTLEITNYKGLSATIETYEVTDAMVEEELDYLKRQKAKTKALEDDRPAEKGHVATISHTATDAGEKVDELSVEKMPIELGQDRLFSELESAIIGMKVGEEKDITVTIPQDFRNEALAGKTLDFHVKIEELKEILLPELDDELAKDIGFETVDQLRSAISDRLSQQAEQSRRQQIESSLLDQLITAHPFEVPPSLVDQVIDSIINEMRFSNDSEKKQALSDQEFRKKFRDQAKRRAQNTLILLEVATKENVQVSDEDIDQHLTKMFGGQTPDADLLGKMRESMAEQLRENLIFDKSMNFLIENAHVVEIPKKIT